MKTIFDAFESFKQARRLERIGEYDKADKQYAIGDKIMAENFERLRIAAASKTHAEANVDPV